MNRPIAPFNTQMAKQKSKYRKDANNVGKWPDLRNSLKVARKDIGGSFRDRGQIYGFGSPKFRMTRN